MLGCKSEKKAHLKLAETDLSKCLQMNEWNETDKYGNGSKRNKM